MTCCHGERQTTKNAVYTFSSYIDRYYGSEFSYRIAPKEVQGHENMTSVSSKNIGDVNVRIIGFSYEKYRWFIEISYGTLFTHLLNTSTRRKMISWMLLLPWSLSMIDRFHRELDIWKKCEIFFSFAYLTTYEIGKKKKSSVFLYRLCLRMLTIEVSRICRKKKICIRTAKVRREMSFVGQRRFDDKQERAKYISMQDNGSFDK